MKFIKLILLWGILITCGYKSFADGPLIKQFYILDSDGNKWILTATAIDGKFPSNIVMIDGNCPSFLIRNQQSQFNTLDLITPGIAAKMHIYEAQGIIVTGYQNDDAVIATANINPGVAPIQIGVFSILGREEHVPITFHIMYQ